MKMKTKIIDMNWTADLVVAGLLNGSENGSFYPLNDEIVSLVDRILDFDLFSSFRACYCYCKVLLGECVIEEGPWKWVEEENKDYDLLDQDWLYIATVYLNEQEQQKLDLPFKVNVIKSHSTGIISVEFEKDIQ